MAREGIDNPFYKQGERGGGEEKLKFYMGPDNCNNDGWQIGLANVATFLSQSMTMGILNDTCDELNWEEIREDDSGEETGVYPLSNACGMRGRSYNSGQMYTCPASSGGGNGANSVNFDCSVDTNMKITAVHKSPLRRSPPAFQCYPQTGENPFTGYFDFAKGVMDDRVIASVLGRTDVEGCCWWGR